MVVAGLTLALFLVALGAGTAHRQGRTRRRLKAERFIPSDERAYLRGQVVRRTLIAVALAALGGMISWYYVSGMDDRMNEIVDRARGRNPADEDYTKYVAVYWIGVCGLVFAVGCLAVFDFWATRRYWMAQYKLIKADHEAKLQRDLAVYRQTKENDRLHRLRGNQTGGDTDEAPPVD